MILKKLALLENQCTKILVSFGRAGLMLFNSLVGKLEYRKYILLLMQQIYNIGVSSILVTVFFGLFIGMVLGLQGYFVLTTYGAESSLGMLVALSLFRELGPVITALLFAGRVGSSLTSEIAIMRVTEQFSSMEMMAIDPLHRVISPRFWASIISLPLLTFFFIAVGILGSALVGIYYKGVDLWFFWLAIQSAVNLQTDLMHCFLKSIIFAVIVAWISLFNGYDATPTSSGISFATTRTVVHSSLFVVFLDFILTTVMFRN